MDWQEVMANPQLKHLPFKIEINRYGVLEMSPTSFIHGLYQTAIVQQLLLLAPNGLSATETPIQFGEATRVPDAIWMCMTFYKAHQHDVQLSAAPEICIEVISPSNTKSEIKEKTNTYFKLGGLEVWLCDQNGAMRFYDNNGQLSHSTLIPNFPAQIQPQFPDVD